MPSFHWSYFFKLKKNAEKQWHCTKFSKYIYMITLWDCFQRTSLKVESYKNKIINNIYLFPYAFFTLGEEVHWIFNVILSIPFLDYYKGTTVNAYNVTFH